MRLLILNLAVDDRHRALGFTVGWINQIAATAERVDVITHWRGPADLAPNVFVQSLGAEERVAKLARVWRLLRAVNRVLRAGPVDCCFAHMAPQFAVLAYPQLRLANVPIVTWYAHWHASVGLRLSRLVSDAIVTSLTTSYPLKLTSQVHVIGQGIDTNVFAPCCKGDPETEPEDLLYVGRLAPTKRIEILIEALAILKSRFGLTPALRLVGDAPGDAGARYRAQLVSLSTRMAVEDQVHFEPGVDHGDLPAVYRSAAALLNATPTGSGDKVILESMSCGVPAILCNAGFGTILGEHSAILLFKDGDPADLADKIRAFLNLPAAERRCLSEAVRNSIQQHYSLESLVSRLLVVCSTVARSRRRSRVM